MKRILSNLFVFSVLGLVVASCAQLPSDTPTDDSGKPTDDSGKPGDDSGKPADDVDKPALISTRLSMEFGREKSNYPNIKVEIFVPATSTTPVTGTVSFTHNGDVITACQGLSVDSTTRTVVCIPRLQTSFFTQYGRHAFKAVYSGVADVYKSTELTVNKDLWPTP